MLHLQPQEQPKGDIFPSPFPFIQGHGYTCASETLW